MDHPIMGHHGIIRLPKGAEVTILLHHGVARRQPHIIIPTMGAPTFPTDLCHLILLDQLLLLDLITTVHFSIDLDPLRNIHNIEPIMQLMNFNPRLVNTCITANLLQLSS